MFQIGKPSLYTGTRLKISSPQNQITCSVDYQIEPLFPHSDIVVTWLSNEKATIEIFQESSRNIDNSSLFYTFHYIKGKGISF